MQQAISCGHVDGRRFDQEEGFTRPLAFTTGFGARIVESWQQGAVSCSPLSRPARPWPHAWKLQSTNARFLYNLYNTHRKVYAWNDTMGLEL